MGVRRSWISLLFVLLAGNVSVAKGADDEAKQLLVEYRKHVADSRDIGDDPGWIAFKRRLTALRKLGPLDCPTSRAGLLRVVRRAKHLDDRLLAAQGLASSKDVETVKALLAVLGPKGHPVLTEGAAATLRTNESAAVTAWLVAAPGQAMDAGALAIVVRALVGREVDGAVMLPLLDRHIDKRASIDLAFDVVKSLGAVPGAEASKRLLRAAGHSDHRLRLAAADTLAGRTREDVLDAAIRRLLNDDEPLVRYAMLRALGEAKALDFLPVMTERLVDERLRVRKTALDALRLMSGQDFGFDMGAWRRWHESKDGGGKPGSHTVPTYHGKPLWSDRLAFILDRSGSMGWPFAPGVTPRMDVVKAELQRALGALPKGILFNVLAFDGKIYAWKKGEAEADASTIKKAQRFVAKQESEKGANTNTHGVLERALLQNPRIDTIYLLSDGIPEWGDLISREGLLTAVREWNRYRRITIHTFAITHMSLSAGRYKRTASMKRATAFMQALAEAAGGDYRFIARPPK